MTNWDYIKTLDSKTIAERLSLSVIPDNEEDEMYICGAGHFVWEEDLEDWLNAEHELCQ